MIDDIVDTYGSSIKKDLIDNKETVINNYNYLKSLNVISVDEIFTRYIIMFLDEDFKKKINDLILKLGEDYIEKIEEDLSIFDRII